MSATLTGIINGEAGNDMLDAGAATGPVTFNGDDGKDSIQGSAFDDSLDGGAGDDRIFGGAGNDTIHGNDTLDGEAGTDRVIETANASLTLYNNRLTGNGIDSLAHFEEASLAGDSGNNILDASVFTLGPVTLTGNAGNDTLLGTSAADVIDGGNGIDQLRQSSRFDQTLTNSQLIGNATDSLNSLETANLKSLSALGSTIDASIFTGHVTLTGGEGPDHLLASLSRNSVISGRAGNDTIDGGNGNDWLNLVEW